MQAIRLRRVTVALLCAMMMHGCGGSEDNSAKATAEAETGFATADALIELYNALNCDVEQRDLEAAYALYYAESPLQERLIGIERGNIPYARLQHEVWLRFGEPMSENQPDNPLGPFPERAMIIERTDGRATARYPDDEPDETPLYLVEVNGRWWISGYTLEHDPDTLETIAEVDAIEELGITVLPAISTILERVRADEFGSVEEVRAAWSEMMTIIREERRQ